MIIVNLIGEVRALILMKCFGKYVKLMIIKLLMLMLNLHASDICICICILVFCSKLVKYVVVVGLLMNSWLIVVVVVMRCVVDELMPLVFIIIELWCELSCC